MKLATPEFSFDDSLERRPFTRRSDLTETIRLTIANNALNAILIGGWGRITELANEYNISRTFVYSLAETLKELGQFLFKDKTKDPRASLQERKRSIEIMLSIRLESCGSIANVSTVMKRQACDLSSIGSINQTLSRIGGLLPMTIDSKQTIQYLVFASDEIFSKTCPVLVTVAPCSSAILRIELLNTRNADDWKNHFECLLNNGMVAIYLVSDDGSGVMCRSGCGIEHTVRQSDTYHAVAHTLGSWVDRFEKSAYKAIKKNMNVNKKFGLQKANRHRKNSNSSINKHKKPVKKPLVSMKVSGIFIIV